MVERCQRSRTLKREQVGQRLNSRHVQRDTACQADSVASDTLTLCSGLKNHSCWMLAEGVGGSPSVDFIRDWMGVVGEGETVAKHLARKVQCFTTTRQALDIPHCITIPDDTKQTEGERHRAGP